MMLTSIAKKSKINDLRDRDFLKVKNKNQFIQIEKMISFFLRKYPRVSVNKMIM